MSRHLGFAALPLALAVYVVVGCAHAPSVSKASLAKDKHSHAFYSLPKVAFQASIAGEKRTFKAGPATQELIAWEANEGKTCTLAAFMNPDNICYWRLETKKPNTQGAVAVCATDMHYGVPGEASLRFPTPATLTVTAKPDPAEQYAVRLGSQPFEQTEMSMAFSNGVLSSFTAKSTSLVAETLEKVTGDLVNVFTSAAPLGPKSMAPYPRLSALIRQLKDRQDARTRAASLADSAAAVASMDAQIAQLRALAEGVQDMKPFEIKAELEPSTRWPPPGLACNEKDEMANADKGYFTLLTQTSDKESGPLVHLSARLGCGMKNQLDARLVVYAHACSRNAARTLSNRSKPNDNGLRYRVPTTAAAAVRLICKPPLTGECVAGMDVPLSPNVTVPQWGTTLALPRRLGWRAGSLDAKLDASTGALTSINASQQGSLEAALVADAHKDLLARREAASKDSERAALERERAVLEHQVKICEARRTLGLPPGDGCP